MLIETNITRVSKYSTRQNFTNFDYILKWFVLNLKGINLYQHQENNYKSSNYFS